MRRFAGLLLAMGCSAEADFLALPGTGAAETWLASRSDGEPWRLERLSSASTPIRAGHDGELLLLEYDSPTGLRGDAHLTRADFGSADCAVLIPAGALELRTEPVVAWERPDVLPASLDRVLRALARPDCHHCVDFEARTVVLAPAGGQRLGDVRALVEMGSQAVVALRPIEAPVRVDRSGAMSPITGCPASIETLAGPSEGGRYWAASPGALFELSISADETECREERRIDFPTPWRQLELLRTTGPSDELEIFILGATSSTTWQVLRFDGRNFERTLELPRQRGDYRDILRVGAQDLLFTNEHELLRWTAGASVPIPPLGASRLSGLAFVPGLGVYALGIRDLAVVALEFDLTTNRFAPPIVLAELADRILALAPFRGGFVALHRGGQTVEYHPELGVCPTRTELGDNNHAPAFTVSFPDGAWVTDSNGEQRGPSITWFVPTPPEPPSATEF